MSKAKATMRAELTTTAGIINTYPLTSVHHTASVTESTLYVDKLDTVRVAK